MPVWLLWVAGGAVAGWVLDQAGDAAEQGGEAASRAGRYALAGGVLYVGYRVAQAQGWAR
jgi:hypothetical protein